MNHKVHNQIVSYIWGIADDVLRDVFVRGKYRDIILPFTVLRRIDVLLDPTKEKVLESCQFMIENKIDNKAGLTAISAYPFYNTSSFTMGLNGPKDSEYPFASLLSDPDQIDSNLETYLDGFSDNVQEIISKFKVRNQLETMRDAGITYGLIEKLTSASINLSPDEVINTKGEKLPGLSNLGMGYVFEELIRKFNEENNEEAGEHFTPREIIRLMTQIIFEPIKEKLRRKKHAHFTIYDPACGSGGMLTEAEKYAKKITENKCNFTLLGQEVNPETWAICTGDMLIKGESPENIIYGSTLGNDGFAGREFDFMLSNPPYGKSWKIDEEAIVRDRGKKNKEIIKDPRFHGGLPSIDDGQLLFLVNMISKMKRKSDLGSRFATIHNGSALFTGDAGQGASNIRQMIIERDLLECIIALPKNIFYNTGIPTYVWILSNRKEEKRRYKVQLINAIEIYQKLRKNLGQKNCELSKEQIESITQIYLDFKETEVSKIFDNDDFGYWKITVDRPLRMKANITREAIEGLRFHKSLHDEMRWVYSQFGDKVYNGLRDHKKEIEKWIEKHEIKITAASKKKLFDLNFWRNQEKLMKISQMLFEKMGDEEYSDFNLFKREVDNILKDLGVKLSASEKKAILNAVSWKDEEADPVRKIDNGKLIIDNGKLTVMLRNGELIFPKGFQIDNYQLSILNSQLFLPDSDLRDSENVPLDQEIEEYFEREVLPYVPDAWIDHSKTVKGYEISFTRYFYNYEPPRSLEEIGADIARLQEETEGILEEFINV
ncbi:class I SAM-dependent DNA methyltransferase [Desulfococcaceae bacterium HSG8]|nr:class I SAM-dependent DNA methyltransferase [Desulfococcaceae bacterium HSG8]